MATYCTQCGKKNDQAAKFCFACGEKLQKRDQSRLARIQTQEPTPEAQPASQPTIDAPKNRYNGLRGWLAYFILSLVVSLGYGIYNSYTYLANLSAYGDYATQVGAVGITFAALALLELLTLFWIFKRKRIAIQSAMWMLFFAVIVYGADAAVAQSMYQSTNTQTPSDLYDGLSRALVFALVWLLYLQKSKRVAATFTEEGYN
jgi:hypothetical protein